MSDRANQLFVFSTVDSNDAARRLADGLVDAQLAACVNILPPITSVFRWAPDSADAGSAAVQADSEVMLIAKTSAAAYPELEAQLRREHPYDLPEIVAIPVSRGLPEFLQWIDAATSRA